MSLLAHMKTATNEDEPEGKHQMDKAENLAEHGGNESIESSDLHQFCFRTQILLWTSSSDPTLGLGIDTDFTNRFDYDLQMVYSTCQLSFS